MKVLITGSRELTNDHYEQLKQLMRTHYPNATEIWHGGARGADALAERYAMEMQLPATVIRPDYKNNHPKAAPHLRNYQLVKMTEATLAVYGKTETPGTKSTVEKSKAAGHRTVIRHLE